jgi:hypothetical protein
MAKGDGWAAAAADLQNNVVDELQLEEAPMQPKSNNAVDEQDTPPHICNNGEMSG